MLRPQYLSESLDEIASGRKRQGGRGEQIRTLSRLAQARYARLEQQIGVVGREDRRGEPRIIDSADLNTKCRTCGRLSRY